MESIPFGDRANAQKHQTLDCASKVYVKGLAAANVETNAEYSLRSCLIQDTLTVWIGSGDLCSSQSLGVTVNSLLSAT